MEFEGIGVNEDGAIERDAAERAERALEELASKRTGLEVMRRAAKDLASDERSAALRRIEGDLRSLDRVVTLLRAEDDVIGLFFRYRFAEGASAKLTCRYFQIGMSTGTRYRRRLIEILARRPDIVTLIEAWAASKTPSGRVGRHKG